MPEITTNTPSWLSAIRTNDKPVYLHQDGHVSTGKSLKGMLVGVAESLGVFKEYSANYRLDKAIQNRDAYNAVWSHVRNNYGLGATTDSKQTMQNRGYASPSEYISSLKSRDPSDPQRAVAGRELREIVDTARGLREQHGGEEYMFIAKDEESIASRRLRGVKIPKPPASREQYQGQVPSVENVNDIPENMWDPRMWVPGLQWPEEIAAEKAAKELAAQEAREAAKAAMKAAMKDAGGGPKELARATVEINREAMKELVHGKTQLRELASELGYDPDAVSKRRDYIESKLNKIIETDPRAKSDELSKDDLLVIVREVFDKSLTQSAAAAKFKGGLRTAAQKMKHALDDENLDRVDILKLSKERASAAVKDTGHMERLMKGRLGAHNQKLNGGRRAFVQQYAVKRAMAKAKDDGYEVSPAEIDTIITEGILKSFEMSKGKARMRGFFGKAGQKMSVSFTQLTRTADAVREKAVGDEAEIQEIKQQEEQTARRLSTVSEKSVESEADSVSLNSEIGATTITVEAEVHDTGSVQEEAIIQPQQPSTVQQPPVREDPEIVPQATQSATPPTPPTAPTEQERIAPQDLYMHRLAERTRNREVPNPHPYKGVDYFNLGLESDAGVESMSKALRNHQSARQVVEDGAFLRTALPVGVKVRDLSRAQLDYIKTTLLQHVAEHEQASPRKLITLEEFRTMLQPITQNAVESTSNSKLRMKTLGKKIVKTLGRKDVGLNREVKRMERFARQRVNTLFKNDTFVQQAVDKGERQYKLGDGVANDIKSDVKTLAAAHVQSTRTAVTNEDIESFVRIAVHQYAQS